MSMVMRSEYQTSGVPGTSLIDLLDDACLQALSAQQAGRRVSEIHVHPSVYRLLAREKARDFFFGNPLTLLGLRVVEAPDLYPDEARVV